MIWKNKDTDNDRYGKLSEQSGNGSRDYECFDMELSYVGGKLWRTRSDKKRQGMEAGICEGERIIERRTRIEDNRGYEELNGALVSEDPGRLRGWMRLN